MELSPARTTTAARAAGGPPRGPTRGRAATNGRRRAAGRAAGADVESRRLSREHRRDRRPTSASGESSLATDGRRRARRRCAKRRASFEPRRAGAVRGRWRGTRVSRVARRPTSETRGAGALVRGRAARRTATCPSRTVRERCREWRLVIGRKPEPSGERSEEHAPGTRDSGVEFPGDENALARRRLQKPTTRSPLPPSPTDFSRWPPRTVSACPPSSPRTTRPPPLPPWLKGFLVTSKSRNDVRRAGEEVAALLNDKFFKLGYDESSTPASMVKPGVTDVPYEMAESSSCRGAPEASSSRSSRRQHRERPPPRRRYASFVPSDKTRRGFSPSPPRESGLITPPSSVATQV